MEILSKTGCYEYLAEPFHCDFSLRLQMGHLGNHLLNAADFHSNERGYGMTDLNPIHKTWVLSRLAVEMTDMPRAYDRFTVETWVESAMRYFTSRNFAISRIDGYVYGYGRSVWAMIDTDTRQPADIFKIRDGLITQYVETERECPIEKASRVKMTDDEPLAHTLETRYSDVDVNGHINSIKYIDHVLDLFDIDFYSRYALRRFDIAYVAESYFGDRLQFYCAQAGESEYHVRITKISLCDKTETEVCRCRICFVER